MDKSFSFSVTGYLGHEEEVLQTRNRNRSDQCSRAYLDWRYLGEPTPTPPLVFWVRDAAGSIAGMASLIFRPYLVKNEKRSFGVLGDISINPEHRGQGLSTQLFQFMRQHMEASGLLHALVLPTQAVEKSLRQAGWLTAGHLVSQVCILEPVEKCRRILKIDAFARLVSAGFRAGQRFLILAQTRKTLSVRYVESFDAEFQNFWDNYPKNDVILHDRSVPVLTWRYCQHPDARFTIGKFYEGDKMIGYVISTVYAHNGMGLIVDLLLADPRQVKPCLAMFLRDTWQNKKIMTMHIVLPKNDSLARPLWKLGFLARDAMSQFQIHQLAGRELTESDAWFITAGDKDA